MIISTLEYLAALIAADTPEKIAAAKSAAERAIRTVTPSWVSDDEERDDGLCAVHPDDGNEYPVDLQDCNGSCTVSADMDSDRKPAIGLRLDPISDDWSDTCLIAIFRNCSQDQVVFFVSPEFEHEWR